MSPAQGVALGALFVWVLLFAKSLAGIRKTPVLRPAPAVSGRVFAYLPARDEREIIEASVRALLAEEAVARLVAVDDRSTDGTGEVLARLAAEDPRLLVLRPPEPASGRCGKPSGLAYAYAHAPPEGEWLLFVDADVVLSRGAVGALLAEAERSGADLVTVVPTVTMGSLLERVVMPAVGALVLAHLPPARVNDPDDDKAFANGQVILLRRAVYEDVGGHEAVASEVLEDVELARRVKAAQGRLRVVDGRHLAQTRMYASWAELWEGWTKNLYLLMDSRLPVALGWAIASVLLGSLGWIALAVERGPAGLVALSAIVSMQAVLRWRGGASPWYAPLAPVGALIAAAMLLSSAARHRSGAGVRWKGRTY